MPGAMIEAVLEPSRQIVDPHHHLFWLSQAQLDEMRRRGSPLEPLRRRQPRYLFDEYSADIADGGDDVRASVYVEGGAMYKTDGPPWLRSIGETEFANGVAAIAASGVATEVKMCAGIVGKVDLARDEAPDILEAHLRAGGGRYRGVRVTASYDPDDSVPSAGRPNVLADSALRAGAKHLPRLGLALDVHVYEPQLGEVLAFAKALPDVLIVLNHVGTPLGIGPYRGRLEERYPIWRDAMAALSGCENMVVKLGGLGMHFTGLPSTHAEPRFSSAMLADEWRPYIEPCIEYFGVDRCMFESNFPVDALSCSYRMLWNAFKRLASGGSEGEKAALFSETAKRVYRLD